MPERQFELEEAWNRDGRRFRVKLGDGFLIDDFAWIYVRTFEKFEDFSVAKLAIIGVEDGVLVPPAEDLSVQLGRAYKFKRTSNYLTVGRYRRDGVNLLVKAQGRLIQSSRECGYGIDG